MVDWMNLMGLIRFFIGFDYPQPFWLILSLVMRNKKNWKHIILDKQNGISALVVD
jgi:hypothetical protein